MMAFSLCCLDDGFLFISTYGGHVALMMAFSLSGHVVLMMAFSLSVPMGGMLS
jgi:hypothetical protein